MDLQDVQRVDRQTWKRYMFYIDLIVMGIFVVSLILLIRHTFLAGQYFFEYQEFPERDSWGLHTDAMWFVVADTAFVVSAFVWIVYRFFRNQYLVMTRRF